VNHGLFRVPKQMIHVAAPEPAGLVSASQWYLGYRVTIRPDGMYRLLYAERLMIPSAWSGVTPEPAGRVLTYNTLQDITWEETKTKAVDAVQFPAGALPRVQGEEARREAEAVDNQVCIRGPIADGLFYDWPHHSGVVGKAGMTDRKSRTGV